jgi:hypothetical protein
MRLAFLALSTTGPDVLRHETWEMSLIIRDFQRHDYEQHWQIMPVHLASADPDTLRVNGYYDRIEKSLSADAFGYDDEGLLIGPAHPSVIAS